MFETWCCCEAVVEASATDGTALVSALTQLNVDSNWFVNALTEAISEAAESLLAFTNNALAATISDCLGSSNIDLMGGALDAVKDAAIQAATGASGFLKDLNIDFSVKPIPILKPDARLI